jgi:hypothetical protein
MVIKHTEETNSFSEAWKFCVVGQNVQHWKTKNDYYKREQIHTYTILEAKELEFHCHLQKKVLDFVLAIWKNGLLITRWAIQMHSLYKEWLIMSMKHMTI